MWWLNYLTNEHDRKWYTQVINTLICIVLFCIPFEEAMNLSSKKKDKGWLESVYLVLSHFCFHLIPTKTYKKNLITLIIIVISEIFGLPHLYLGTIEEVMRTFKGHFYPKMLMIQRLLYRFSEYMYHLPCYLGQNYFDFLFQHCSLCYLSCSKNFKELFKFKILFFNYNL